MSLKQLTITEKILARSSDNNYVKPGEIIEVKVDLAVNQDNDAALVIKEFKRINVAKVWDPSKVVFVIDHHSPSTTAKSAEQQAETRQFILEQGVKHFFDCGQGVSHNLMLESGLAETGKVILGLDSHTTGQGAMGSFATGIGATDMAAVMATGSIWLKVPESIQVELFGQLAKGVDARDVIALIMGKVGPSGANYQAMEYTGDLIKGFDLTERATLCMMSLEIGAKNAIIVSPEIHETEAVDSIINSDSGAEYAAKYQFDVSNLEPMVACPSLPTNVNKVSEVGRVAINQAIIGSCAGGSLRDIVIAADILKNRRVKDGVRLIVTPNTRKVYLEALKQGKIATLIDSGAVITSPACGACAGYEVGVLAPGETCISTTTRNMPGRMGPGGQVYLSSAATVAASALTGYITDPREFINS